MTKIEIYELLDTIYSASFLEGIEIIASSNTDYKKSDFYKKTKIQLSDLFKNYFIYRQNEYGIEDKVNNFISGLNKEDLADKTYHLILSLIEKDKSQELAEKIISFFDIEELQKNNKELEKSIKKLYK